MDTGGTSTNNGNGKHDPEQVPAPSTDAVPKGAPVEPSGAAEVSAGNPLAPEPLVVIDRDPVARQKDGKLKKGVVLNPRGRPPGVPNRNTELYKLFTSKEIAKVKALAFAQAKKGDNKLLEFLLDRILLRLTPESAGVVVNVSQTNEQNVSLQQTFEQEFVEELKDPGVRAAFSDLVNQRAERLAKSFDEERESN